MTSPLSVHPQTPPPPQLMGCNSPAGFSVLGVGLDPCPKAVGLSPVMRVLIKVPLAVLAHQNNLLFHLSLPVVLLGVFCLYKEKSHLSNYLKKITWLASVSPEILPWVSSDCRIFHLSHQIV